MAVVRTIICGSPQPNGKCNYLAGHLCDALQFRFPQDEVRMFDVSKSNIAPCIGCNTCLASGHCFMTDDMDHVLRSLEESAALFVVSPVYFAGPPSQLKALLDRLQPFFARYDRSLPKKPARLIAVGAGGDPHGYGPLEIIVRSSLAVSGFSTGETLACIGETVEASCTRLDNMVESFFESDELVESEGSNL